jgi:CRP-like cAMP-binding protein
MDAAPFEVVRRDAQSRRFRRGQALFVEGSPRSASATALGDVLTLSRA